MPPQAILEILSDDAGHDLRRKDAVYAEHGVARRAYLDPYERHGWWIRLNGADHSDTAITWHLEDWPELRFERDELLAA